MEKGGFGSVFEDYRTELRLWALRITKRRNQQRTHGKGMRERSFGVIRGVRPMRGDFSVADTAVGKDGQGDRFCGRYEEAGEAAVMGAY